MKKETKKKKKQKKHKIQIDRLDIVMIIAIVLLGIFIIYQGFKLVDEIKHKDKTPPAHIVIPVIEKKSNSVITLTMSEFKEGNFYRFKVTNYRNGYINKQKIAYTINISNEDETDISIYKNGEKEDLAKEGKSFEITGNKLKSKERQIDVYELKLNNTSNVTKNSKVIINIKS